VSSSSPALSEEASLPSPVPECAEPEAENEDDPLWREGFRIGYDSGFDSGLRKAFKDFTTEEVKPEKLLILDGQGRALPEGFSELVQKQANGDDDDDDDDDD
jgi:hypothetical protein